MAKDSQWNSVARLIVIIVPASIALMTSGCAGSTQRLTQVELVAKANSICRRIIDEVDWRKTPPYKLVLLSMRLGALEEQASTELSKFDPPAAIVPLWQLMVDDFRVTGQQFEKLGKGPKLSPQQSFYAIEPVLNAMRERAAVARSSGLEACAQY
jgi:hypothetical protein